MNHEGDPAYDSSPCWMAAHWSRLIAPVPESGQEIDQDVVGVEREEVAAGGLEGRFALRAGRDPDRFDGVDPERLDDRAELVHRGEHSRAAVPYGHVPKHQDPASPR